jgi:NAD(P)-dependent dehydrogenase (short-subunit alcohol dehydrogenase family)
MAAPAPILEGVVNRLENKIALITGGYGGMGRASARLFAAEGATVFVAGRSKERGEALVKELTDAGGKAYFTELDVVSQDQWDAAVAQVKEQAGALHVLMNIVGSNALVRFPHVDIEEWNRLFETNVTGTLRGIQTCAPLMKDSGGGSIVNIGSEAGITGGPEPPTPRPSGPCRACHARLPTSTPTGASVPTSSSPAGSTLT